MKRKGGAGSAACSQRGTVHGGALAGVREWRAPVLVCPFSEREGALVRVRRRGEGAVGHRLAWRSLSGRGGRRACPGVRRQGE
jgi:hypothetical protein